MLGLTLLFGLALVGCSRGAEGPYPPATAPYPPAVVQQDQPKPVGPYPPAGPVGPYPPAGPVGPYPPAGPVGPYPPAGPVGPYPPAGGASDTSPGPQEGLSDSPALGGGAPRPFFADAPKGNPALPETLVVPKNTRIKIQDDRLQYTHGFNDDSTGTTVNEQGRLFTTNDGWEYVIIKKGAYSYVSPEGLPVTVNYVADHNGFRVIGEIHG